MLIAFIIAGTVLVIGILSVHMWISWGWLNYSGGEISSSFCYIKIRSSRKQNVDITILNKS